MDEISASPAAIPDFSPAVDSAPVADAPVADAAPDIPAAPSAVANNEDVQATNEGRSDFTDPQKGLLDLQGSLPTGITPKGVTASVTKTDTLGERDDKDLGLSAKVTNASTVSLANSEASSPTENGPQAKTTTNLTGSNTTTLTAGVSNGRVGVTMNESAGASTAAILTTPKGTEGGVDPRDPAKMAVGTKLEFSPSATLGQGEGATLNGPAGTSIGASENRTVSNGLTASVEKVDENTVRVSAGTTAGSKTEDALQAQIKAGKAQATASLSAERGNTTNSLETRDFDLRNPQAREAYQRFITGQSSLPAADPAAGIQAGSVQTFSTTHDNKAAIEARLGPLGGKVSLPLTNADGTLKVTNNPDGTTALAHSLTFNNQNVTMSRTFGADGTEDLTKRRYDFVVNNADPTTAGRLAMGASNNPRFENAVQRRGAQDVQLSFTQADIDQLRLQAGAHPYSQDPNSFIGRLSRADDPAKLFSTFTDPRSGAVNQLGTLANRTGQAIPGQAWFLDRNTGQAWRPNQPVTRANGVPLW